jgi:RimJ/RimL family protein N-acetyltransferase
MLKSSRVLLRPLAEKDLPALFSWVNDRQQMLFNAPYRPVTLEQHHRWFAALQQSTDRVAFGIERIDANDLIGTCQLVDIHPIHRTAELTIRLAAEHRGHGLGAEALSLLLEFAFRDLNLERVSLHVFATNEAAVATYRRVGFKPEGAMRSAAHIDGRRVDVLMMGILRAEYVV